MFGWLPIIGPIIDGIVSIFDKAKDTEVVKYKTDAEVETARIKSSQQTLTDFRDQIDIRILRDIALAPGCVWTALTCWDYTVVMRYPDLVWGTKPFPPGSGLELYPYAILTFLFGAAALSRWKQ